MLERNGAAHAPDEERHTSDGRVGRTLEEVVAGTSRRGFLARAGALLTAATTSTFVAQLIQPGEADGYHFCGHTYTTDSCPHPMGGELPRIDRAGYPLRPKDGRPIDNIGRLVNKRGEPVDEKGETLKDPDGRALPPAPRTKVCEEGVKRRFGMETKVDGSWYRCCSGQVRKLIDCCSYNDRRINGDASLTGYCFRGRKVFCVMYYDTNVPC